MKIMQSLQKELIDLWNEKKEEYEEHLDLQKFKHDAENADSWIAVQEAFFKDIDHTVSYCCSLLDWIILHCVYTFQDSLDTVEEMIKKQNELENMLKRQDERFKLLEKETQPEKILRKRVEAEEKRIREEQEAILREEQKRMEEMKRKEEEV